MPDYQAQAYAGHQNYLRSLQYLGAATQQAGMWCPDKLSDCRNRRKAAILRASRLVDGRDPETGLPC